MSAECQRCGSPRQRGENRHRVTFHDETDGSMDHSVFKLCPRCYRRVRDLARTVIHA